MQTAAVPDGVEQAPGINAESPEFLRRMSQLVPGIIYIFNHQTMSNEYSNRSIGPLLGYSSEDLVRMGDRIIETCVHKDDLPGLTAYFASLAELDDGEVVSFDYRDYAKDGSVVWLRSIDSVYERAEDGSVLRHIGIAFDVTREKEAEQRLQAMRRELEQLTYIASHDLKVPVSNMASLTHMLSDGREPLPDEHAETLSWMQDVCAQAQEKLDALVCVAQANSERLDNFGPVDLAGVAARVFSNLRYQIRDAGAEIRTEFETPRVHFLSRELENMLQAMVANALRYRADDRPLRVCVGARTAGKSVEVFVSDNGTGLVLPRDEEKVFGLFKRAHNTPEGAGVALYTIRSLMERIGGSVHVSGAPDKGAVFTLVFPQVTS